MSVKNSDQPSLPETVLSDNEGEHLGHNFDIFSIAKTISKLENGCNCDARETSSQKVCSEWKINLCSMHIQVINISM